MLPPTCRPLFKLVKASGGLSHFLTLYCSFAISHQQQPGCLGDEMKDTYERKKGRHTPDCKCVYVFWMSEFWFIRQDTLVSLQPSISNTLYMASASDASVTMKMCACSQGKPWAARQVSSFHPCRASLRCSDNRPPATPEGASETSCLIRKKEDERESQRVRGNKVTPLSLTRRPLAGGESVFVGLHVFIWTHALVLTASCKPFTLQVEGSLHNIWV